MHISFAKTAAARGFWVLHDDKAGVIYLLYLVNIQVYFTWSLHVVLVLTKIPVLAEVLAVFFFKKIDFCHSNLLAF